jgi:hypothetical protein
MCILTTTKTEVSLAQMLGGQQAAAPDDIIPQGVPWSKQQSAVLRGSVEQRVHLGHGHTHAHHTH